MSSCRNVYRFWDTGCSAGVRYGIGVGEWSWIPALPPPLPILLARVLLVFAIEFEGESEISLAIGYNVLRVLDEEGVRVRGSSAA